MSDFEPIRDVLFRGKPLPALTPQEMLDALSMALKRVRYLETIAFDQRHQYWNDAAGFVPSHGQSGEGK